MSAIPDRDELWWECRLHAGFGTIEVRAPDVQAAIADVEVIATLVHTLVRELAARHAAGDQLPAHQAFAISENRWRAATDGVEGELIDLERDEALASFDPNHTPRWRILCNNGSRLP